MHLERGDWHFIDGKVFCLFSSPSLWTCTNLAKYIPLWFKRKDWNCFVSEWLVCRVYVFAGCKWCLLPGWDLVYHCKWGDSHQLKYPHGSPRAEMSSFPPLFSHTQAYMNALLTLAYNINNAISIHNAQCGLLSSGDYTAINIISY